MHIMNCISGSMYLVRIYFYTKSQKPCNVYQVPIYAPISIFYSNRSLSYVFVTTGMAFLLMAFVYVLVDFKHVWQGEPFLFAGKSKDYNSINRFGKK